ncbi:unnamed protein product [Ixodes hexagonus]
MAVTREDVGSSPECCCQSSLESHSDIRKHPKEQPPGEVAQELALKSSTVLASSSKPSTSKNTGRAPSEQDTEQGTDSCGGDHSSVGSDGHQCHRPPKHPKYAVEEARRATMATWPRDTFQDVDALVAAGLYYDGHKDRAICFSCGGALCGWDQNDDPLIEHYRWYPHCTYVGLLLGPQVNSEIARLQKEVLKAKGEEEYNVKEIDDVIAKTMDSSSLEFYKKFSITQETFRKAVTWLLKKGVPIADIQKSHMEEALKEITKIKKDSVKVTQKQTNSAARNLCAVCWEDEKSVMFLPCQHLVACVNCASAVSTCPMCRTPITRAIRAFFC